MDIDIKWWPQPRQLTFLEACGLAHPFTGQNPEPAKASVIGYGGAAGGGKSDGLLAIAIIANLTYPGVKVGYFRRKYTQLEGPGGAIMRSHELLNGWAKWNGTQRRWTLPGKGILEFCYCDSEKDVHNYQSSQFDIILFDEGTQFTEFQYRYMLTRNRATVDYPSFEPFTAIGTNPGGVGHRWFKSQFVDAGEPEKVHEVEIEGVIERHIFIPAFLEDNQILMQRDPGYRRRIAAQGETIRKQLLEGDWDIFEGQYFPEFRRNIHVIKPFEIPHYWTRFRTFDYGLDCMACYWITVDGEGKLYVYRELWEPGLTLSKAAVKVIQMTPTIERDVIAYTLAPPDLWNKRQETGLSGEEIMRKAARAIGHDFPLRPAENARIPGWRAVREYLDPYEIIQDTGDGEKIIKTAHIQIFNHCKHLISDLPALLHDDNNPEDAAGEPHIITHAPEALRYGIKSRPPASSLKPEQEKYIREMRRKLVRPRSRKTGY